MLPSSFIVNLSTSCGDKPSINDGKIHGKKGNVKFPCNLFEGNHPIHIFPYMDEASKVFENLTSSQPRLSADYQKLSPIPPLVVEVIDQNLNTINPTLFEPESPEFVPTQTLVDKMVDSILPSVDCAFLVESESHTAQGLLVSSNSNEPGDNPPVPMV